MDGYRHKAGTVGLFAGLYISGWGHGKPHRWFLTESPLACAGKHNWFPNREQSSGHAAKDLLSPSLQQVQRQRAIQHPSVNCGKMTSLPRRVIIINSPKRSSAGDRISQVASLACLRLECNIGHRRTARKKHLAQTNANGYSANRAGW